MSLNLNTQKENLLKEKAMLTEQLSGLGVFDSETNSWEAVAEASSDKDFSDENDNADRFEDYEEKSAMLSILKERWVDVKDALKKIEEGRYGICEISGEQIEEERLIANPAARTSIKYISN